MPRFQNSGEAVEQWSDSRQEPSHSVDLCDACACVIDDAKQYPSWVLLSKDEPKGTLERADWHPDYDEVDYRCCFCNESLGEEDNDEDACDSGPTWSDFKSGGLT